MFRIPYRSQRLVLLIGLAVLSVAAWAVNKPALAAASPVFQILPGDSTACHPVDVVVLIDQSETMFTQNDKEGERFQAAQTVVEQLGNHALWLCRDQGIKHRISIIGFGDEGTQPVGSGVNNPYQEDFVTYINNLVVPITDNFREWEKELGENVTTPLTADGVTTSQLGATDHYSAFLAASDQLQAWRAEPLGELPRRQSVILISDGEPCLRARGCTEPGYSWNPDLDALDELTDPLDSVFPWLGADNPESVYISLIAMSQRGASIQENLFGRWEAITQNHGGDVKDANAQNTNLNVIAADIINPIGGSGMEPVPCNTDVWVYPYTDNLVIIYAGGTGAPGNVGQAVIRIDAGGQQFEIMGGQAANGNIPVTDYFRSRQGRNEYYIFQPPIPGRYNIGYTGADLSNCSTLMDIRATSKPVIAEVTAPTAGASFPALTPPSQIAAERFRLEVFESIGDNGERVPLVEFEDYPSDVIASVSGPDAHAKTYAFEKIEDGVYESTELIQSPAVGEYTWSLRATVETLNPEQPEIVILEDDGRFSATEVIPFGFAITRPADGASLPLNTVNGPTQSPEPIAVAIDLLDASGDPTDVENYLTDVAGLFTASLLKGDQVIETVPLSRTPGSAAEFSGVLTNSTGSGVVAPGDYSIQVNAAWSPENYTPLLHTPANEQAAIAISQYEVIPLDLRITGPDQTTVHVDNWLGAFRGQIRPVDFSIEVVHAVTQEVLDLQDVLQDPQGAYQAAIVPPSGNPILVPLTVTSNENFQRLEATGGATEQDEAGQYAIKLDTSGIALNDRYAWAGAEASAPFTREDTTFTSPTTWRLIVGTVATLLALLLMWIIYRLTGGPTGQIALYDMSSRREIPLRGLRSSPRVNTIKSSDLTERGVKHVKVRRGGKDEEGRRTVIVTALGTEGESYLDGETLTDGINEAFLPSAEIVYHSR